MKHFKAKYNKSKVHKFKVNKVTKGKFAKSFILLTDPKIIKFKFVMHEVIYLKI